KDPAHDHFSFVAEAQDAAGNKARQVVVVYVSDDKPPTIRVSDPLPADTVTKGALAFQTVHVDDDYATPAAPLSYFAAYTSLKGLGGGGTRDPSGETASGVPNITLAYPDATALPGTLSVHGKPYLEGLA